MTDSVFTIRLFLDWHDSVQWFAYGLLGALLVFVSLQYVRARRSPAGLKWFGGNNLDSTNIIKMLAGDRHRKAKGSSRS